MRQSAWEALLSTAATAFGQRFADLAAIERIHTGGGTRTLTPLRETDFESVASANSATPAVIGHHRAFVPR